MSGWAWVIWTCVCTASAVAAVAGGLLLAFAVAGQRGPARRREREGPRGRCDCCGYALDGLEGGLCPECGWAYADNRRLPRIRRVRAGAAGLVLLLTAGAGALSPEIIHRGVLSVLPDTALIVMLPLAPAGDGGKSGIGRGNAEPGSAVYRELQYRIDAGRLDGWERSMLAARCAGIVASDRDESARAAAAWLLKQVAADAGASAMLMFAGLGDGSASVRARVLGALCVLGEQGEPGALREQIAQRAMGVALCDRDERVRRQAIETLGRLRTRAPGSAGVFARAARDPSPMVRVRTVHSMIARSHDDRDPVRELGALAAATHDPYAGVREAAVFALGRVAERGCGRGAALHIERVRRHDESGEVRKMAAGCLARLGPPAAPAWMSLLVRIDDEDPGVQEAVRIALSAMGS